ncbi:MAG: hypothetical protein JW723_07175 [Bacteroidales bacterium]|nr:hypothetical protein [Bacteroidales bacterium]
MPYRRLPNTDAARLRALKTAFKKGKELPPFKLAFSQSTLHKIQSFLPSFEKALLESRQAYSKQLEKSKSYAFVIRKAKLYISHFIQVLNMAILRGDIPSTERKYYGTQDYSTKLPALNTEADLIKWGEKLIHGESIRAMENRSPITNPTIAVVKVRYEQFLEAYKFQKILQKNFYRVQEKLEEMRIQANDIIVKIWNEVEDTYKQESGQNHREKAETYGIIYVFRKSELLKNDSSS